MRWELSEEQADFRSVLADWLADCCPSGVVRGWIEGGDPEPFERRFAADGWFAVGSPEELGGEGGGLVELALAAEELGKRTAPAAGWFGSMLAVPGLGCAPDAAKALLADGITTVLAVPAGAVPDGALAVESGAAGLDGTVAAVLGAERAQRLLVPADGPEASVGCWSMSPAFTGRTVEAVEAERVGLLNRVVDDPVAEAHAIAAAIAGSSPGGIRMSKRALQRNQEIGSYAAAMELENRGQALMTRAADMPEALAAFREKRPPRWTGR